MRSHGTVGPLSLILSSAGNPTESGPGGKTWLPHRHSNICISLHLYSTHCSCGKIYYYIELLYRDMHNEMDKGKSERKGKERKRNTYREIIKLSRQIWQKLAPPCRHVSSSCRCRWGVSTPCPWPQRTQPHWRSSQRSLTWETRTGPTDRSRWPREPTHHQQGNNDLRFLSYSHFMHIMFFLIQSKSIIEKVSKHIYNSQKIRSNRDVFWSVTRQQCKFKGVHPSSKSNTWRESGPFRIPWSPLLNSCAQYSSPAGAGLRLSWRQVTEDAEG